MKVVIFLCLFCSSVAKAITVAVIDTGFDLDHEVLRPRLKLGETDEEGAPALAGMGGWHFQDNTHLKSSAIPGAAVHEVLLYRTLKAKSHQQGLTPDERLWLEGKSQDPSFKEKLRLFKKHVHGTLVAGILLSEGQGIEVFPVRGLGIDVPTVLVESGAGAVSIVKQHSQAEFERQVKLSEERVIQKFKKMLAWIHHHQIRIVNASYGVTEKHITRRFAQWHQEITGLALDEKKLAEIVERYFLALYRRADRVLARYPDTLFIFSAGNSQQDNDLHHHFPSRIRRNHVISVAALNGDYLASFSNWGSHHVDIAAPGVGILSLLPTVYRSDPGLFHTPASGTSMAAPSVANLAARCLQINGSLKAFELKELLLGTGVELIGLKDKIASGRAVQPERALKAAELSQKMPLSEAMQLIQHGLFSPPKPIADVSQALLQTLPRADVNETDDISETASSPSSLKPDQARETPDNSGPPAAAPVPETPSAPSAPSPPSP